MDTKSKHMEEYVALVREFPLVSIRSDEHLEAAIAMLHRLLDLRTRSEAQEEYLGALTDLIETYESIHVPIRQASGVEVVRHLMEAGGLRQKDLSEIFGNKAITSQVLSGKRPIGLTAARRLSTRFALPLDIFLNTDASQQAPKPQTREAHTAPSGQRGPEAPLAAGAPT
jgi:HTH-type transcriptional regulator/antitoxin HigA